MLHAYGHFNNQHTTNIKLFLLYQWFNFQTTLFTQNLRAAD